MKEENDEREELIDEYVKLTNETANIYNESYRNLSNALLAASSIYMAVVASIATSQTLALIPFWQLLLLSLSILSFLFSIVFGIVSHMNNVNESRKMYEEYRKISNALVETDAIAERYTALKKYEKIAGGCKDKMIIVAQIIFFAFGVILLMFPLCTTLVNNWLS